MIPDLSQTIITSHGGPPRILIVDDEDPFCQMLARFVELTRCEPMIAHGHNEAIQYIRNAEKENRPFSLVTIDMRFEGQGHYGLQGSWILSEIKSLHPYIACVVISGETVTPEEVLGYRDTYDLDYFLQKDRLDPLKMADAILRATKRVRLLGHHDRNLMRLNEALVKWRDVETIYTDNLAHVERQKAEQGLHVTVEVENQIRRYRKQLEEARAEVTRLEADLHRLAREERSV